RATALFSLLILSLSFLLMKLVMLSITRSPARCANVDIAIVRISHESMTAPLQLAIQFVQHNVREQRRQWSALRRSLIDRTYQAVFHHSGVHECPNQLEHSLIGYAFCQCRHQSVVMDSIKEFLQVDIHNDAVSLRNVLLRFGHGLMRRSFRSKTVAVIGKR